VDDLADCEWPGRADCPHDEKSRSGYEQHTASSDAAPMRRVRLRTATEAAYWKWERAKPEGLDAFGLANKRHTSGHRRPEDGGPTIPYTCDGSPPHP
jgi:hypothetical protein